MEADNMKAMREAIETIRKYVKETTPEKVMLGVIEVWCDEALAEPPRQCDVGTIGEQYNRFDEFCASHYQEYSVGHCGECPFAEPICKFAWAQTPYNESEETNKAKEDAEKKNAAQGDLFSQKGQEDAVHCQG